MPRASFLRRTASRSPVRRLTPFGEHKHHYRFGPVPDGADDAVHDFGKEDVPWTCDGRGRVIDE